MNSILEQISNNYFKERSKIEFISKTENEIKAIKKILKENLSERQRKLLLGLEDRMELINEINSSESFAAGFKKGLKLGFEVNSEQVDFAN